MNGVPEVYLMENPMKVVMTGGTPIKKETTIFADPPVENNDDLPVIDNLILSMAVEIMVIFHSYVAVYQMVTNHFDLH